MRKSLYLLLLTVSLLAAHPRAAAQGFTTEKLKKAAGMLGIATQIDTLDQQTTHELTAKDGQRVNVRMGANHTVEHIGIPLFNPEMRIFMPSPVYDFMEYAVLNWKYKVAENRLYLQKVLFKKGSWSTLAQARLDSCDCSIDNKDDRLYVLTWNREGEDIAIVGIPIDYELLGNDTRRNMERDFIRQLSSYQPDTPPAGPRTEVTEDDLTLYGTGGLFVLKGDSHLMPELNQNTYYQLATISEQADTVLFGKTVGMTVEMVVPKLVVSEEFPAESFANLMLGRTEELPDALLDIDFHMSDYHNQQRSLPLSQLRDFCRQQGDELYFACSGYTSETTRGMLFIHNAAKGYNHLLSLQLPTSQLTAASPQVQAHAYLYIPPIDQKHLFGKTTPAKKSGAKAK